jgi:putative addiction module component (TIGR02574 family)
MDVVKEALKLPPEARAALAGTLLESLDEPIDDDSEAAWSMEIRQRLDDLDSGKAKTVPWSELRRRIHGA